MILTAHRPLTLDEARDVLTRRADWLDTGVRKGEGSADSLRRDQIETIALRLVMERAR